MEIPNKYQSDVNILIDVSKKFSGKVKSFDEVFRTAKDLRNSYPNVKSYEALSPGHKRNFENRLARFLAGTIISANHSTNEQPKIFNIENILGKKCTEWTYPINPIKNLSPQVKRSGQKFRFPDLN